MRSRAAIFVLGLAYGCSAEPESRTLEPERPFLEVVFPVGFSAGTLGETAPSDNLLTEERASLGRRLFFDPNLSRTRDISCASCHDPARAFTEPRSVSRGVGGQVGNRNAPSLVNLAAMRSGLFWDGRAPTLEAQVGQPITNPIEMDLALEEAVSRVGADQTYVEAFERAYESAPTSAALTGALASFLRVLVSGSSPYDRYLRGDSSALSESAQRGRDIFLGERGGCFHCHTERMLTNDGFFNNGTYVEGGDIGRQSVTGLAGDRGKFRVPGLRNVEATAPYMHDGSLPTLEAVIDQYARGGRGDPTTDAQIGPLALSQGDKADLVAFLKSFTDQGFLNDRRYRAP
ncbi:MAG: cytochrome c peroxidase [Polyangiaceae bacterium]|nr:cytochrome c peroxidase [Polyangiaceae bacterium]